MPITSRNRKSRKTKRYKKTKRSTKKYGRRTRGGVKGFKTTPITDPVELRRLEEADRIAEERERNDNEIRRINTDLERQRINTITSFPSTPMSPEDARRQQQQDLLSPILPIEPTPLPPAPSLTSAASRLMLNLLDAPRFNDSLVYYTQIIDRELTRSRQYESQGHLHSLSYDVIQQQTKIIPYCTINNPLNDICPISQVPFDLIDSVMQINSCKHNFNPYSLIRWFDTHSTCPMCRRQINVDVENDDDEQTIHMYNEEEEPYRSESNRYNENNYSFDS
jgi:hypothetical protein